MYYVVCNTTAFIDTKCLTFSSLDISNSLNFNKYSTYTAGLPESSETFTFGGDTNVIQSLNYIKWVLRRQTLFERQDFKKH